MCNVALHIICIVSYGVYQRIKIQNNATLFLFSIGNIGSQWGSGGAVNLNLLTNFSSNVTPDDALRSFSHILLFRIISLIPNKRSFIATAMQCAGISLFYHLKLIKILSVPYPKTPDAIDHGYIFHPNHQRTISDALEK